MKPLVDSEKKVMLALTPRAGSVTGTKMFFRAMGLLEEALAYDPWVHRYRAEVFYQRHPFEDACLTDPAFYRFKIVRDPFRRAVSSYRFVMQRKRLREADLEPAGDLTFREFLRFLSSMDPDSADVHYAPQYQKYEETLPGVFDRIVKIEHLQEGIRLVNEEAGTGFDPAGMMSPHHARYERSEKEFSGDRKWSVLQSRLPDPFFFYDTDLAQQVLKLYRRDFEAYGYPREVLPKEAAGLFRGEAALETR